MSSKPISFVTGANGFVGSHLVEYLLANGHEVHCLLRKSSNDQWLKHLDCTLHRGGIEDTSYLQKLFLAHKVEYIFHLAGTVKAFDYQGFYNGNVMPTNAILEACLGLESLRKIVVTSSIAATQPAKLGIPNDESVTRKPLTDYGKSKVAEEDLAISYFDRLPIAIVRPPVVYGERDSEVLLFFKTVSQGLIPLIGFEAKSVSLVHVRDLVHGIACCGTQEISAGQTYFIGGHSDEYTWDQLGSLARNYLGRPAIKLRIPHFVIYFAAWIYQSLAKIGGKAVTFNIQKANEMVCESWSCTSQKAKTQLGYNPQISIEKGFEETITWYKSKGWL
jgi:dihydroflavonol-4-reductase